VSSGASREIGGQMYVGVTLRNRQPSEIRNRLGIVSVSVMVRQWRYDGSGL
jgi:hypothetical protein